MAELMLATTKNSTSIHFGLGHMCERHMVNFALEHLERCDAIVGCYNIKKFADRLKVEHILKWDKEERLQAILEYGYLAAQLDNLTRT